MRKFLIILDDTPEMLNAMRYAALRASQTGGAVEMLAVISPEEFQHFMGVADVMRAEAREKVEAHFQLFKDRMEKREGITPTLAIREAEWGKIRIPVSSFQAASSCAPGGPRRGAAGKPGSRVLSPTGTAPPATPAGGAFCASS